MTTDLPLDVRERAARAAFEHTTRINPYPSWDDLPEEWREIQRGEVDAVAEVLAAGMAEEVKFLRAERELYRSEGLKIQADRDALKARVEQLEQRLGSHPRVRELSMQARIAELSTALAELIMTVGRHATGMSMREAAPLSTAIHKATMAWTPKESEAP